jgi:hypothetical protein
MDRYHLDCQIDAGRRVAENIVTGAGLADHDASGWITAVIQAPGAKTPYHDAVHEAEYCHSESLERSASHVAFQPRLYCLETL